MSRFPISYRDNPNYDAGGADAPRLLASIDLSPYGIDGRVTDLPVHVQTADAGAAQDFYTAWIAGLPLENGSLDGLSGLVDVFMKALARQERLPRYMFHVGDRAWPIYQLQGELIARYPGGPVFAAPSVAELWIALANHFKHIGRIASRRDLEISFFSQADLQIYAPDFSLRFPTADDIPVFAFTNGHGPEVMAPVGSQTLRLPIQQGSEVLAMYRLVGDLLVQGGRLKSMYDMSIRKLATARWDEVRAFLRPTDQFVTYTATDGDTPARHVVPVYTDGSGFMAARQTRPARVTVYVGQDVPTLQERMAEEMVQRGVIDDPGAVQASAGMMASRGLAVSH
ncbi:MAG: hypothetical protein KDI07_22255 [Anaerolineae bacterium]|nr:hypothetical protein [Anaerolineae bacterium]MCB9132487.1 hypothetical protein [Anaerolineales bacterium]MCB9143025.1 hypothetical protein [Anaerolineales bacterium]